MNLFGKKEEEFGDEGEDEMSYEEKRKDIKLARKFRDLNPENKKKRKEPPKPWGKKERLIVGGFFLFTTILAAVMFLVSHDYKFPGLPRITFNAISFKNPFGEQIIEIGQKVDVSESDEKAKVAINLFKNEIRPIGGFYGFIVVRLNDGSRYGVSTNGSFQGASLLKLPLMVLMYKMSEEGNLNLNTKYTLKESDKVEGAGTLDKAQIGSTYTYRQLAGFMGKDSDRTAYKVMKEVVGSKKLDDYVISIGMKNTNVDTGNTTPQDVALLLQKLWKGNLVGESSKDEILGYLTNTFYEKWITAGLPKNIKVAHKFGQDLGVMTDGGIIETENPYVLVIMGNGITQEDADSLFPKVSKDVYNVENGM